LYWLRLYRGVVSLLARPCRGRRSRQKTAKQHCWQRLLSRIAAQRAIAVEGSGTRGTSVCATDHDRPAGLPVPQCAAETGGKTTWSSWLTENVSRPGHASISRQLQSGRPGGPNPSDWTRTACQPGTPSHDRVPGPLSRLYLTRQRPDDESAAPRSLACSCPEPARPAGARSLACRSGPLGHPSLSGSSPSRTDHQGGDSLCNIDTRRTPISNPGHSRGRRTHTKV
jgi:hypothetical protein